LGQPSGWPFFLPHGDLISDRRRQHRIVATLPREAVIDKARAAYDRARLLGFKMAGRRAGPIDIDSWMADEEAKPISAADWRAHWQSQLTDTMERIRFRAAPEARWFRNAP